MLNGYPLTYIQTRLWPAASQVFERLRSGFPYKPKLKISSNSKGTKSILDCFERELAIGVVADELSILMGSVVELLY